MTVEKLKPKPKQLLQPITTGAECVMTHHNSWQLLVTRVHGAIGFGFASHWLKN